MSLVVQVLPWLPVVLLQPTWLLRCAMHTWTPFQWLQLRDKLERVQLVPMHFKNVTP